MKYEQIIIASGNKGKIKEAKEILAPYDVISINELGIDIDVEENEDTFEGNAIKKAKEISKRLEGKMCIADDSGIEIEYLDGFPSVRTKRWLKGTDRERNIEILKKMEGVKKENRKVRFVTAIALANGTDVVVEKEELLGYISTELRGKNGFGFDEIFELQDGRTLAELTDEEKNMISSRKKALEKIKEKINE